MKNNSANKICDTKTTFGRRAFVKGAVAFGALASWVVDDVATGNDFTGKVVHPFTASSSFSLGDSVSDLAALAGTGERREGARFSSGVSVEDVTEWLNGLGAYG